MAKDVSRRVLIKIGVALSMTFSALLAACTGRDVIRFELDELQFLNGLTREELNERLRELAEEPSEVTEIFEGAMCYIPIYVEPKYTHLPCSTCNASAHLTDWQMESLEEIQATVNEMISAGFDVKLDVIISCERCSGNSYTPYKTIFGIKFVDDADYHLAETSNVSDYQVLLAFLQGEETYSSGYDEIYPLYRRRETIAMMTGLKYD